MNVAIIQVSKEFIDDAIEKMMAGDKNLPYGLFWTVEDGETEQEAIDRFYKEFTTENMTTESSIQVYDMEVQEV